MPRDGDQRRGVRVTGPTVTVARAGIVVVEVPSSKGEAVYAVTSVDGAVRCTCPGWRYRQTCKHASALLRLVAHVDGVEGRVSVFVAKRWAELYCKHLDEGGFARSETHIEMCRMQEEHGR